MSSAADILNHTAQVVQDRGDTYGSPGDNMGLAARFVDAYRAERSRYGRDNTTSADVAVEAILHKVARLAATPDHEDTLVDIAGYAACAWEIIHGGEQ